MKKMMKIVNIILTISILLSFTSVVLAEEGKQKFPTINPTVSGNGAEGIASNIIGYIQWIGYAISVGMLVYVGIKYVMSSAAEKADLKQNLIRYVIGAVLIAAAVTIADIIFTAGKSAAQ